MPLLDWDAARRLTGAGFHVGCHSLSHPLLTELRSDDCRRELQAARERLEDKLGRAVVHLAYPFGSWNDQVRQLAAESGFRTGCTVCPGLAGPDDDPLTLPRVPVTGDDSLVDFMVRLHRAHSARELVRDRSLAWVDRARKMLV
jgi:peptidoglycan/xylan/chitin deacetylase (PgdA/CDA1 family)